MRKIGLLVWPLAALIGAITLTLATPSHNHSPYEPTGVSSSLVPS
jgi:hypothetical protein